MANQLFEQAIAEAKTVREAAIANAKLAMEESLTPHLKELLAQRLAEMEEEEEMETEKKAELDTDADLENEQYRQSEVRSEETLQEAEEEEAEEAEAEAEEETEEAEDESEESEDEAEAEEEIEDMTVEELKELIRDILSQELESSVEGDETENMEAEEELDMVSADDAEIDIDEVLAELAEMEKEDEVSEEEVIDEGFIDKLKKIYNDPEVLGKIITVDGKKMSLKDFLGMAGGATAGSMAGGGKSSTDVPGSGVSEELNEALATIETLRKNLNEVNLLNAKLLYVNKIFKANNLDESQKVNIIAAFDKAETVKEAKLVFESVSTNIAPKKERPTRQVRSFASKPAGVSQKREIVSESSDIVKRMQKIAGII